MNPTCRSHRATGRAAGFVVLWALVAACAESTPLAAAVQVAPLSDSAASPPCSLVQRRPNSTCCPAGQAYVFAIDACIAVGPPDCAAVAFDDPRGCVPRWCWTGESADGSGCDTPGVGSCALRARRCSDAERAVGAGCPAGSSPSLDAGGGCVPAGSFAGSGIPAGEERPFATLPAVPPADQATAGGAPAATPLAAINDTFLCRDDATAAAHFCGAEQRKVCARKADGALPDPERCVHVGVPWAAQVCPPGFLADASVKTAAGELAPCVPDPADCGADAYGDPPLDPSSGALFVDGKAGSDANEGTRKAPLRTISKALTMATAGGTVAVAAGVYTGALTLTQPVTLRGRCAAMVAITGPATVPTIRIQGAQATTKSTIARMRIGAGGYGVQVTGGPELGLERVWIKDASITGLYMQGANVKVRGDSLVVEATQPHAVSKGGGVGVQVNGGARLTLADARVSANRQLGIVANQPGSSVIATRLLVDGTLPDASNGTGGRGVTALAGAKVAMLHGRVTASHDVGIFVHGVGSQLQAINTLIDNTRGQASDKLRGRGVHVQAGATATLRGVRLSANRQAALSLRDPQTSLTANWLLIDGTLAQQADGAAGRGVDLVLGARLQVTDARVTANLGVGVYVKGVGSSLDARRLLVDKTAGSADGGGRGIAVQDGARAVLQAVRLHANREIGLFTYGAGTTVQARRLLIDATLPRLGGGLLGRGLDVTGGALVDLRDARLSANRSCSLLVEGAGSHLEATGLLIDGTLVTAADQLGGRGMSVQNQATARLQGSRVVNNREIGVGVGDANAVLTGVTIEATAAQTGDNTGGFGVWALGGTQLQLDASVLRGNRAAALAVDKSTLRATDSVFVATAWGDHQEVAVNGDFTGQNTTLADGTAINGALLVLIDRCLFAGNQRAAILIESSVGAIVRHSLLDAASGRYGLVVQRSKDSKSDSNAVFGATVHDRSSDAGLSLPAPPQAVSVAEP